MKKFEELPPEIQAALRANAYNMKHFYTLPTDERQNVLDSISELNKKLEDQK